MVPFVMSDLPAEVIEIRVPESELKRCAETLSQVFLAPVVEAEAVSAPIFDAPGQRVVCVAQ